MPETTTHHHRLCDDYVEVVRRRLAETRTEDGGRRSPERFEVLGTAHHTSPFLTLAEWPRVRNEGIPRWVLKVLMVLPDDNAHESWFRILKWEEERFATELNADLQYPGEVRKLPLPLARDRAWKSTVTLRRLGPIRRQELLGGPTGVTALPLKLDYLERPFIPWPILCDVGYAEDELKEKWKQYCTKQGYPSQLEDADAELFTHFCEEALVGPGESILTSAWRFRLLFGPGKGRV